MIHFAKTDPTKWTKKKPQKDFSSPDEVMKAWQELEIPPKIDS
jgi:hypothetical protein